MFSRIVQFLWAWFKNTTHGVGQTQKMLGFKVTILVFALLFPFSLTDTLDISLSGGDPMSWHPSIGLLITILIAIIWAVASLVVTIVRRTKFEFVSERIDLGSWKRHYRVPVRNTSSTTTIQHCSVSICEASPHLNHMPIRLHCSGQDFTPDEERFSLHPREERTIDVLVVEDSGDWKINAVSSVVEDFHIPKGRYRLKLVISGEDAFPCERYFIIEQKPDGSPILYEEGKLPSRA
jgi:hypothetical protein